MWDAMAHPELARPGSNPWRDLAYLYRDTGLVTWPMWLLESEARMADIAARHGPDPRAAEHQAIAALAARLPPGEPMDAERFLGLSPKGRLVTLLRHCLAGQAREARALAARIPHEQRTGEPYRSFFSWADTECRA
jgi:hypothetical protein